MVLPMMTILRHDKSPRLHFEALGQLRGDPVTRQIPVMAVTASAMSQDRQKIMAAGFDAYHSKPISLKTFVSEVTALIERGRGGPPA